MNDPIRASLYVRTAVAVLILFGFSAASFAGSATWSATPVDGKWNNTQNWVPQTVPKKPADTASFDSSSITSVSVTGALNVNGIIFNPGASAYTLTAPGFVGFSGTGLINNSGLTQSITVPRKGTIAGFIDFVGSATAGSSVAFTVKSGSIGTNASVPTVEFDETSSAGSATFTLEGGSSATLNSGGHVLFYDNSTAADASFIVNGSGVASTYVSGGFLSYGSSAASTLNGNFTINGATVGGSNGGTAQFDIGSNVTFNGTFVINGGGGGGSGNSGGEANFLSDAATFNGPVTLSGGTGAGGVPGRAYIEPTILTLNGNLTVSGGTARGTSGGSVTVWPSAVSTGTGSVTINGGTVAGAYGGNMTCEDFDAGASSYTVNGGNGSNSKGGTLYFNDTHRVSGTLIANSGVNRGTGGFIELTSSEDGTVGRLEAFGNGTIYLDTWDVETQNIGSIEGTGIIEANDVSVGNNNLSTTFAGSLQISSLTKVGTGILTLTSPSSYFGGTTISDGALIIANAVGSGAGTGSVFVDGGIFGGTGINTGAVTVGQSSGTTAYLAPGDQDMDIGFLTLKSLLTFAVTGTYSCELDSDTALADKVVAKGVAINAAAQIELSDLGATVLPLGTVFTIIDNMASGAISGVFSNLPDGSVVAIGSNNYQASYTGGTGNDLTLTVVP